MSISTVNKLDFSSASLVPTVPASKAKIQRVLRAWPGVLESQQTLVFAFRRQQAKIEAWKKDFKKLWMFCDNTGEDVLEIAKMVATLEDRIDVLEWKVSGLETDADVEIKSGEDEQEEEKEEKEVKDKFSAKVEF